MTIGVGVKILVVTGSSGGHIFPALSFLEALKDRRQDVDTLLVLPKKILGSAIIPDGYKVRYICISAIKLSLSPGNFLALLRFFKGSLESLFLILEFRPDIVVGFGSLVSVPLVLLAWIFRIKTLVHEQNVIPGQANRLLAKFSDKVAVSFAETENFWRNSAKKIVFTGNPLRRELKRIEKNNALDFFGLGADKFTILVIGGSAGSHRVNLGFLNALSGLQEKNRLGVIHLSGAADYDWLEARYKDLAMKVKLFRFFSQMQYAYSAADLVVCRAGATTLAELIFFRLPAVIIPYPFAYQHQAANAALLQNRGCAVVIKDRQLDSDILRETIEEFLRAPDRLKNMRLGYEQIISPPASDLLIEEVLK